MLISSDPSLASALVHRHNSESGKEKKGKKNEQHRAKADKVKDSKRENDDLRPI